MTERIVAAFVPLVDCAVLVAAREQGFAAEAGLGYLLNVSDKRNKAAFFAVILVILVIAFACDQVWRYAGNLLFPYRKRN